MKEEMSSPPTRLGTKESMEDTIWAIWAHLGTFEIQAIIDSMPIRIQAVLLLKSAIFTFNLFFPPFLSLATLHRFLLLPSLLVTHFELF